MWSRLKKHRGAIAATVVLCAFAFLAIVGPYIAPYDPRSISWNTLSRPTLSNLMGTDNLGRDILSQVLHGVRVAMVVGFSAALISTVIGVGVGGVAGFSGGVLDGILMRFTDGFMVVPSFFLILIVSATFGSSLLLIAFLIGITAWPVTARVVRAEFLALRSREFILAEKALGAKNLRVILVHLLPNALPAVLVISALRAGGAILQEASLSFLGLGDPNAISLGKMLMNALQFMRLGWWTAVFPGMMIFVLVLAFNLFSDGVNDACNPRSIRRV